MQQLELAGDTVNFVIDHAAGVDLVFDAIKQERMLANFSQLHELVAEALDAATRFPVQILDECSFYNAFHLPFGAFFAIGNHLVLLHLLVKLTLQCTHSDLDNLLDLVRELGLDILLQATE